MRYLAIITVFLLMQENLAAQHVMEEQKNGIDKTFNFNNENYEHSFFIDIEKGRKEFTFQIKGQLVFGSITATLYDPNDKREGGFILQGDDNPGRKTVSANGNIVIPIENPIKGKWSLKIKSVQAKGQLTILMH